MFREMRRKDRQLDDAASIEILTNGKFGILATCCSNGYPYTTPINYGYFNNCIYFHCAVEGLKIENMENNNKVCFCVTSDITINPERLKIKFKSIVVFGIASEVFYPERNIALKAIIKNFSGGFTEKDEQYANSCKGRIRVFKIQIEHITGKTNTKPDS